MEIAIIFCFVGILISLFLSESNKRNLETCREHYNGLVKQHNLLNDEHNNLVDKHNELMAEFNKEQDLNNSAYIAFNKALLPLLECKKLELMNIVKVTSDDDITH